MKKHWLAILCLALAVALSACDSFSNARALIDKIERLENVKQQLEQQVLALETTNIALQEENQRLSATLLDMNEKNARNVERMFK